MIEITVRTNTVKHMAATGTLTFINIVDETHDKFSDLGLDGLWEIYQARLITLDYWHGKYIEAGPHGDGQTFEKWLLANEQS